MTNMERIRNMSEKELVKEFKAYAKCEVKEYIDLEAWLNSEDAEYPVIGKEVSYKDYDGTTHPAYALRTRERFGSDYTDLVTKGNRLHELKFMSVPSEKVVEG